ncbi:MAG: macro domain-containing protein [Mogibacterium sp.]|nr:macro domain-containing protein [Mogibacterium sp.]
MDYEVIRNDITNMEVDAIVLPANPMLREGSGTSKAIYEKAGRRSLNKACNEILKRYHSIRTGTAVPTLGFKSNAKYIIHH